MTKGKNLAMWKRDLLTRYRSFFRAFNSHEKAVHYLAVHHKVSKDAICRTLEAQEIAEEMRIPTLIRRQKRFERWKEQNGVTV